MQCANASVAGACDSVARSCSTGFYGVNCSVPWIDSNPVAWYACVYLLVALAAGLILMATACMVLFWTVGGVSFPRFTPHLVGLSCVALGGACITVSVAVDPYGFERHASGLPYDAVRAAGLGVVNLLGYALIACAFGVLTVVWLSVRRTAVSRRAWIGFGCFVTFTLVLAVVCPWLALIPGGFEYDRIIFYIYLAVVAFFIGLVIVVTGARTVWAMSRNRDKNRSRMWRVAVHVLIVGALLLACTAVFVVVSFATSDSSFEAFLVVRLVIPGMLSLSLQFALLSAFRFRRLSWLAASLLPEGSQGPASTSLGSSDSALSEQWAANAVSLG